MIWLLDVITMPVWLVLMIQIHGMALGAWWMWQTNKGRK